MAAREAKRMHFSRGLGSGGDKQAWNNPFWRGRIDFAIGQEYDITLRTDYTGP